MKTVLRIMILVICLSSIFFSQISLAETTEKVLENSVIEPIPGKSPEQLITSEEAKENIVTIKQDLEKNPLVSIPRIPEEDKRLLRDIVINFERNGDLFIPLEQEQKKIDPSLIINETQRNDLYQRPRITFFDRSSLPGLEPPNLIHQDLRYYIYGPSYFRLSYLTRKWSAVSDTDDTLLYPNFGASVTMTSTLTITQSSTE